jgi:hypothetical protein
MQGAITSSPLLRTLVVAVPGLALAMLFGFLLGEGNVIVGVLVVVVAVGFLVVMSFARRGVLEAAIVGALLIGYFVGNRGFAQLAIVRPIFVGELGLGILLVLLGSQALVTRQFPPLRVPLVGLVFAYLGYACVRFSFDFRQYGLEAARDLAIVYYAAFFFVAYQLGSKAVPRAFIGRCVIVAVAAQAIVSLLFTFAPGVLQSNLVIKGAPLLYQKGDLTITFAAVAIFFIANQKRILGLRWLRAALLLILIVCAAMSIVRAALLALICVTPLLWLAGQRRFFGYLAVGGVAAAIVIMFMTASGRSVNDSNQLMLFKEKLASIVDVSGNYRYQTELGTMKGDNNEFRRAFWEAFISKTNSTNPIFGRGFGYDFLPAFAREYGRGNWEGTRSPHNYFITVYGRMGLVGLLLFSAIAFLSVRQTIRAAILVRSRRMDAVDFSYWCGALVLLISGAFGVVLEGPMGAIPFWTFLGLALSSPIRDAAPLEEKPVSRHKHPPRFAPRRLEPAAAMAFAATGEPTQQRLPGRR